MAKLTAMKVRSVKPRDKTQRLGDGDGLYLVIRPTGSKAWVVRLREGSKRTDRGLGKYPTVTLAQAREKAAALREQADQPPAAPTFREVAELYIQANAPTWRHHKTAHDARTRLAAYAFPKIGDTPVDQIRRADVMAVLDPIWTKKPAAARKLKQRIRAAFTFALARDWVAANPVDEAITEALPKTPAVKSHFRALPYQEVGKALAVVEASTAGLAAKLCFAFTVLTAARSGESRAATWDEIDLDARTWTVPASRMKANREHRVPLSDAALDVLRRARSRDDGSGCPLVFPSTKGRPLSNMTMTKILRTTGLADRTTTHGFRTSFKTWTMEQTSTPWAVGEAALAHTLGNSTEQAYARSDLYQKRAELMEEWAAFLLRTPERSRGDSGNPVLNADANYVHRGAAPQDVEGTADTNGRPYDLL